MRLAGINVETYLKYVTHQIRSEGGFSRFCNRSSAFLWFLRRGASRDAQYNRTWHFSKADQREGILLYVVFWWNGTLPEYLYSKHIHTHTHTHTHTAPSHLSSLHAKGNTKAFTRFLLTEVFPLDSLPLEDVGDILRIDISWWNKLLQPHSLSEGSDQLPVFLCCSRRCRSSGVRGDTAVGDNFQRKMQCPLQENTFTQRTRVIEG